MHILNMRKDLTDIGRRWAFTFCFVVAVFVVLEMSLNQLEKEAGLLEKQLAGLKIELKNVETEKEYLTRQINSQSDPAWIEMVMKKELGLVPEGQVKIYFPAVR